MIVYQLFFVLVVLSFSVSGYGAYGGYGGYGGLISQYPKHASKSVGGLGNDVECTEDCSDCCTCKTSWNDPYTTQGTGTATERKGCNSGITIRGNSFCEVTVPGCDPDGCLGSGLSGLPWEITNEKKVSSKYAFCDSTSPRLCAFETCLLNKLCTSTFAHLDDILINSCIKGSKLSLDFLTIWYILILQLIIQSLIFFRYYNKLL